MSVTSTTMDVPVVPWHWDSVAYKGVILLNDFNDFVGGELECMMMEKQKALNELVRHVDNISLLHQMCNALN